MSLESLTALIREADARRDMRGVTVFGDAMKRVMTRLKRTQGPFGRIVSAWDEIVGGFAAYTRPRAFVQGCLTVEVTSAPHLAELRGFRRDELLAALQADPRSRSVAEIRFALTASKED